MDGPVMSSDIWEYAVTVYLNSFLYNKVCTESKLATQFNWRWKLMETHFMWQEAESK